MTSRTSRRALARAMSRLLARVAGPLSAHALDGAAFIVPSLEGLLARIVLTLGVLVCHSRNMRPISRDRHPGLSRSRSRHQHVRGERVQFQAVPIATAGGSCQASPPGPLAPSPLRGPRSPGTAVESALPQTADIGRRGRQVRSVPIAEVMRLRWFDRRCVIGRPARIAVRLQADHISDIELAVTAARHVQG